MKKLFLLAVFILASCAPQVTVIPTATATDLPTATQTPAPTVTPTITPIPTYTADDLKKIPLEHRPALVPPSPDYEVGNISTIEGKDNYVLVRDPETGEAIGAWNAFTGKVETMESAGIKELPLSDGTNMEFVAFYPSINSGDNQETSGDIEFVNSIVQYMIEDGVDWGNEGAKSRAEETQENYDKNMQINNIIGIKRVGGFMLPLDTTIPLSENFGVGYSSIKSGGINSTLLMYIHEGYVLKFVYVDMPLEIVRAMLETVKFE